MGRRFGGGRDNTMTDSKARPRLTLKVIAGQAPFTPSRPPLAPTRGSRWTCSAAFFSFRPLNMCGGVSRCRTRYPLGRSRWIERTVCPIVVSMLCRRNSLGDVSENQSRCCWIRSFPETVVRPSLLPPGPLQCRACVSKLEERKGKGVRQGMEEDDRSSLLIVLAYRR